MSSRSYVGQRKNSISAGFLSRSVRWRGAPAELTTRRCVPPIVGRRWPEWLIRLGIWINKPFGVSRDYAGFPPWESVRRYMNEVEHRERYFGAGYISVGEARPRIDRLVEMHGAMMGGM